MSDLNVSFFLKNHPYTNVDMSCPFDGNPGMGGREYMNLLISASLFRNSDIKVHLYAQDISKVPSYSSVVKVKNIYDAIILMNKNKVDFFISDVSLNFDYMKSIVDICKNNNIKLVLRMGLMPSPRILNLFTMSKNVVRIICVEHECAEQLVDHPIFDKITVLRNGISFKPLVFDLTSSKTLDLVYIGSLVEQKGFKRLARVWKDISKHSPSSKLHVIGAGNLYDRRIKMGEFGIADKNFEKNVIKRYLCDSNGQLHPKVIFHGALGSNKYEVIKNCCIGIANPTGATETFCIAAVELQACGLPVVAGANIGLHDTVLHNQTGILVKSDTQFKEAIISLLDNSEMRASMASKARSYAFSRYNFEQITFEWVSLIKMLSSGIIPPIQSVKADKKSIFSRLQTIRFFLVGRSSFFPSSYRLRYVLMKIYGTCRNVLSR